MKILDNGIAVIEGDSHISRWQEESGRIDHDLTVEYHILPMLKPHFHCVDAGAFNGDHTVRYAQSVPNGHVFAFEPNPEAYQCLVHNIKSYSNAGAFCYGLSDKLERRKFLIDSNAGGSHLLKAEDGEVYCVPLDNLGLGHIDFFKLDVEGYELFALKGAEQTIRRCNPIILVEMNAGTLARNGVRYQDIFEFLANLGYQWKPFAQNCDLLNEPQYDLLATPK